MGMQAGDAFSLCFFLTVGLFCTRVADASEGYCRTLRSQSRGARRDGHNEFRLRLEGDPDTYQPGSTYRGEEMIQVGLLKRGGVHF